MNNNQIRRLTNTLNKDSCPNYINFHCHTNFSDGSMSPDKLIDQAIKNSIRYLSITDHHSINAYKYIKEKKLLDKYKNISFDLITGIEISCLLKGCLVHVLGIGIDVNSKSLLPYIQSESAFGDALQVRSVKNSIKEAGGLSFLAHPARYRMPYNILIKEAYDIGIDGIEVWYDYNHNQIWKPTEFICDEVDKLTSKYKMLKTCGTDSHGYSLFGR